MNLKWEDVLAVTLGAFGFVLSVWLGGSLGALIHSGVIPGVSTTQVFEVAARTFVHISDPGNAWPSPWRRTMPGTTVVYICILLVGAVLAVAATCVYKAVSNLNGWAFDSGKAKLGELGTKWATWKDMKSLGVTEPESGRITLGRFGRRLVAAGERQSVLVAAPSQSGKTSGLVVPAILEWEGPVIATSVKGDLLDDTLARRAQMGKVMVFDPTKSTGHECVQATPLSGCGDWKTAREVAHWLCSAAQPSSSGIQEASFWYAQAEKLLAPLLFAARRQGFTMEDVVAQLDAGAEASEVVKQGLKGEEAALSAWQAMQNREAKHLSSIYATAEMVVSAFADPVVQENSMRADYTPVDLLDGKANTLYLVAPLHEQERLAPLFAMMIQEVLRVVYGTAAEQRRQGNSQAEGLSPPLLLALDELANIAPIPDLEKVASTGAAQGIQLLSVVQDFSQLRERFGANRAQTIVNNHRAKVFGSGMSDPETLEYVRRVTGSAEYAQHSETVGDRHGSTTEGTTFRDLTPANVVREQEQDEAVLVYGHLPPARLKLRPWFKDKDLREMVQEGSANGGR